jgi:hypothetical protein
LTAAIRSGGWLESGYQTPLSHRPKLLFAYIRHPGALRKTGNRRSPVSGIGIH